MVTVLLSIGYLPYALKTLILLRSCLFSYIALLKGDSFLYILHYSAHPDETQTQTEHGKREKDEDDLGLRFLRDGSPDLGANRSADGDAEGGRPDDMIEPDVTDDAECRRAGENEMRGCRCHVHREAEQVDHERHMDHAAADAKDT